MLSISLSKKTFGIKNETLLNLAAIFYISITIIILVSTVCEIPIPAILVAFGKYPKDFMGKKPQHPVSFLVTVAHFFVSTLISSFTGLYIMDIDERLTKKRSIRLGCITLFHFIYLFNPWIAKYQEEGKEHYNYVPYTIMLYYVHFYCCLVITVFICWLPWQNQSMRKKPKYKVIHGGNDTKKMPV